jgi:hypothetical protein
MWPRKDHCDASAPSGLNIQCKTENTHPDASHVGASTSPVVALILGNSPSAVTAGKTTRRNTGVV